MKHEQHRFTENITPNWFTLHLQREEEFARQCEPMVRAAVVEMPDPDEEYEIWVDEIEKLWEHEYDLHA